MTDAPNVGLIPLTVARWGDLIPPVHRGQHDVAPPTGAVLELDLSIPDPAIDGRWGAVKDHRDDVVIKQDGRGTIDDGQRSLARPSVSCRAIAGGPFSLGVSNRLPARRPRMGKHFWRM